MFRKIEEVMIGGEAPGEAFGGFIYNVGIEMGYNGTPTLMSINVVNSDGKYNISKQDLTTIRSVSISIGAWAQGARAAFMANPTNTWNQGGMPGLHFKRMYLKDYRINTTPEAKLLSLTYIDRTVWLKKVYLGLINTHGNPNTLRGIRENTLSRGWHITTIPIQCFPCSYGDLQKPGGKPLSTHDLRFRANHGFLHNVSKHTGGMILLGAEEFGKNQCELNQVTYSWNELVFVLKKIGVEILTDPNTGDPTITDRGNPHNRERFTGTLDEVITQWCDKMGYSWGFDPSTEKIYGVDLTQPIDTVREVKKKINSLSEKSKIIVTESSEENTLDGTKVHRHISSIRRPFHKQDSSETSFSRTWFKNIKIEDIFSEAFFGGGRTLTELITSSVLSRFNLDARKIYNMEIARKKAKAVGANLNSWSSAQGDNFLEPLGMTAGFHLNPDEQALYVNHFLLNPAIMGQLVNFNDQFGPDADVFVGTYSKALEARWIEWERAIGDFIGRFYWTSKPAVDFTHCEPIMEINRVLTIEPTSKLHNTADKKRFPFYKILANHPMGAISPIGSQGIVVEPVTCQAGNPNGDGFTVIGVGPIHLIKGATYLIKHTCDPRAAKTNDNPPVPRANKGPLFYFYKDPAMTIKLEGQDIVPNPGGNVKVVATIPDTAPNVVYWRNAAGAAVAINIIDDPAKFWGGNDIWIHESPSAYGTSLSDVDDWFTDDNGQGHLAGLISKYQTLDGYAAAVLLPVLQGAGLAAPLAAAERIAGDGFEPVIWILPSNNFVAAKFKVDPDIGYPTNNTSERTYDTSKKNPPADNCKHVCNINIVDEFCRCINPRNRVKIRPTFVGKVNIKAGYITLSVGGKAYQIILPVESPLVGYHIIKQDLTLIHRAIEYFFGSVGGAGNTMELSVKVQDITNDLEDQSVDYKNVVEKIDNYGGAGGSLPGIPGAGKVRREGKIIVPNKSWAQGGPTWTAMHPMDYHNAIDHSFNAATPTEKFTCTVIGLDFSEIQDVMKPSKGLTSMSISYEADGVSTRLEFSSRLLGGNEIALLKESTFHRLEPLMMLNRFGRTF